MTTLTLPAPVEAEPELDQEISPVAVIDPEQLWSVVVWDDPVNTMDYVTYVFQSYFGYSAAKAEGLMLKVHHEGRAIVAQGSREKAETDVMAMHSFSLQATIEKAPKV